MKVEQIMTRDVVTIEPRTSVADALDLQEEQSLRHLPVVDGDSVRGLVSDRDLAAHILPLRAAIAHPEEAKARLDTAVAEILNEELVSVGAADDVGQAIDAMLRFGVGAVPVIEGERLVGIVTTIDVLQAAREVL